MNARSGLFLSFFFMALANPCVADDGSGVGNGGGGWVCRQGKSPQGEIIWAQLVDLSEADREFKLKIPYRPTDTIESILESVGQRLRSADPKFYLEYLKWEQFVLTHYSLTVKSELDRINDLGESVGGENCFRSRPDASTCDGGMIRFEQLANFTKDHYILIDSRLWKSDRLTNVDRAALFVHEAVYRMLREPKFGGDTDSMRARKIVAFAFSDSPVAAWKGLLKVEKKK